MKIVNANQNIQEALLQYERIIIDLGTGDGRFVYKTAKDNPEALVIGIDPSHKQLEIYAKKANKDRLSNVFLTIGSVEDLPEEVIGKGDEVYINFPWGSLLGGIATADNKVISNICSLLKPKATLRIIFGYSQEAEPSETERLGLNNLDLNKINQEIAPAFGKNGLNLVESSQLEKEEIFKIESSWSKKLTFGANREIFQLIFNKN